MTSSYPSALWWFGVIFSTLLAITVMTLLAVWLVIIARSNSDNNCESNEQDNNNNNNNVSSSSAHTRNIGSSSNFEIYSVTQSALWGNQIPVGNISPSTSSNIINETKRTLRRSVNNSVFKKTSFESVSKMDLDTIELDS